MTRKSRLPKKSKTVRTDRRKKNIVVKLIAISTKKANKHVAYVQVTCSRCIDKVQCPITFAYVHINYFGHKICLY